MTADMLKYFSARLALSYLLFIPTTVAILYFGGNGEYPAYFLYALFPLCFLFSAAALSHLGKWRFNALMVDAQECDITRFFRKGETLFEKLLILTGSFHFSPKTAKRLRERVYMEYSRFLLALDVTSDKALRVHKKALEFGWESQELKAKLISCFLGKKTLERDEIATGIRLMSRDPTGKFLDLLVKNCLKKKFWGYESQEVFRLAMEKKSKYIPVILDQALPDFLQRERRDPFALTLYFAAVRERHRLAEESQALLQKLATPYLFDKNLTGMGKKLVDFFNLTHGKGAISSKDTALGKGPARLALDLEEPGGREVQQGTSEKIARRGEIGTRPYLDWRKMLPDATSFYVVCGAILVLFLGFRLYRQRLIAGNQIRGSLTPTISSPEVPVETSRRYVPFHSEKPFTIQVGAYNSIAKAERVMKRIRGETHLTVYWLPARIGDKAWYRVRVGEFQDQKAARLMARDLIKNKLVGKDYYLTNFKGGFILSEDIR